MKFEVMSTCLATNKDEYLLIFITIICFLSVGRNKTRHARSFEIPSLAVGACHV